MTKRWMSWRGDRPKSLPRQILLSRTAKEQAESRYKKAQGHDFRGAADQQKNRDCKRLRTGRGHRKTQTSDRDVAKPNAKPGKQIWPTTKPKTTLAEFKSALGCGVRGRWPSWKPRARHSFRGYRKFLRLLFRRSGKRLKTDLAPDEYQLLSELRELLGKGWPVIWTGSESFCCPGLFQVHSALARVRGGPDRTGPLSCRVFEINSFSYPHAFYVRRRMSPSSGSFSTTWEKAPGASRLAPRTSRRHSSKHASFTTPVLRKSELRYTRELQLIEKRSSKHEPMDRSGVDRRFGRGGGRGAILCPNRIEEKDRRASAVAQRATSIIYNWNVSKRVHTEDRRSV